MAKRSLARTDTVNTDFDIEFDETSTEPLPQASEVVSTLVRAATDPPAGFNLTVNASSIAVTSKTIGLFLLLIC